jgi:hypothetical protein
MRMRAFPQAYRTDPAGGGPVAVEAAAASIPGVRMRRSVVATPMGSALYLPPLKAMADRALPPQYWTAGRAGQP